jgi:fumarate reductase subunit D
MAKSHKPVVWFPFAAGGTVIAFFIPVIVLLTFLAALGHVPAGLGYESMHAFARGGLGKLIIFGVVALSLWSSAHRLRCTCLRLRPARRHPGGDRALCRRDHW